VQDRLSAHMDTALRQITAGEVLSGLARLGNVLSETRRRLPASDWREFITNKVLTHPIREVMHADPFTYRAFSKPRGYAGDAVMMDYIYGRSAPELEQLPVPARRIFDYCTNTASTEAVRFRRRVLAEAIDVAAARAGRPIEVVALAAGHLREADLSSAVRSGCAKVTAIDQDEQSLDVVKTEYSQFGVQTTPASVRHLLAGRAHLPASDLSYSAGLYDYLPAAAATRLTTLMFQAVRPGGTVLLANFLPDIVDVGYMEGLMDWNLIYRDDQAMLNLTCGVPPGEIAGIEQFHDPFDNIGFLRLTKAA
jgi:extracellular factor (EF) 3-hydroxypalmitic acid methyl ester biosynthesis protein